MMGTKIRNFAPLPREVSLEDLVPKDNFYRRLEATIDLSFVRDLVKDHYACAGRPSIDPVVFFLTVARECLLRGLPSSDDGASQPASLSGRAAPDRLRSASVW
jgi:hypothetical protein